MWTESNTVGHLPTQPPFLAFLLYTLSLFPWATSNELTPVQNTFTPHFHVLFSWILQSEIHHDIQRRVQWTNGMSNRILLVNHIHIASHHQILMTSSQVQYAHINASSAFACILCKYGRAVLTKQTKNSEQENSFEGDQKAFEGFEPATYQPPISQCTILPDHTGSHIGSKSIYQKSFKSTCLQ